MDLKTSYDLSSYTSDSTKKIKILRRSSPSISSKHKRSQSQMNRSYAMVNNFFMKRIPKFIQNNDNANQQEQDSKIEQSNYESTKKHFHLQTQKKRVPTPYKSSKHLPSPQTTLKKPSYTNKISFFQHQLHLQLQQLSKSLQCQRKIRFLFQQKSIGYQKQLQERIKKQKQLQKQLDQHKKKEIQYKNKIKQLNQCLQMNKHDLKSTKSNLEKLKAGIKQNRTKELEYEVKFIKQMLEKEKYNNQLIQQQNCQLQQKLQKSQQMILSYQSKQISYINSLQLKHQINHLKLLINQSKSITQDSLQSIISQLRTQLFHYKSLCNQSLLKLSIINQKKYQQITIITKNKDQQIKQMKKKYSKLLNQYKQIKKKEFSYLKEFKEFARKEKENAKDYMRKNRFREDQIKKNSFNEQNNNDQISLQLELSPDNKI